MLMIFAYDKEYYESYLRNILHPAICGKCPKLLRVMLLILHDIAKPHKAAKRNVVFKLYHLEVLKHPSYSPGPSCSELTTLLVNVLLNFLTSISRICQYFLLKESEKLLQ